MVLLKFCQSSRYGSPSSLGTAVLTEEELDWLQTCVVNPFAPPQKKGRSPVSWRQAKRREHRLEHKLYPLHCPPHSAQPCKGTCRFSGVSGLLCPRRSKWFLVHRNHGVTSASRPSTGPMNVVDASASHALVQVSPGTNLLVERRLMRRMARRRKLAVSGCPVRCRKLLPVLKVWHRPRKAVNREVHAMNGNTSSSASVVSESTFNGHVGPVVLPVHLPGLNLGRGSQGKEDWVCRWRPR